MHPMSPAVTPPTGKTRQARGAYLGGFLPESGKVPRERLKTVGELLTNRVRFSAIPCATVRNVIFSESPANPLWRLIAE